MRFDVCFLARAIAQLRACRPIPEAQVREVCHKARELLIEEANVVTVTAPVTVSHFTPAALMDVRVETHRSVDMRRYTRPIPRPDGALSCRW